MPTIHIRILKRSHIIKGENQIEQKNNKENKLKSAKQQDILSQNIRFNG